MTAVEVGDGWVTATVHGGDAYAVELSFGASLDGECDCPYGREGNFCKHLVALGLTVLARPDLPQLRARAQERAHQLEEWLAVLSRDELLALVHEQVAFDQQLRRRLEVRASAAGGDLPEARVRIAELLDPAPFARYGYVEYEDAQGYAEQALQAAAVITTLVSGGRAADAIGLAGEAMCLLSGVQDGIDDSDGHLARIGAALAAAHLQACRAARPDPARMARWLLEHALGDPDHLTGIDPLDYADVLGDRGLATLRDLAVAAWRDKPAGWAEKHVLHQLAAAVGDVDMVIAVHAADLAPDGSTHLAIARHLDAADRPGQALRWAQDGLTATLTHPPHAAAVDSALIDYLCARYTQTGRLPDVVALRREDFVARRNLETYRRLRDAAQSAGCWPAERSAALARLRADAEQHEHGWYGEPVLIDALLDDEDTDAAWQAARELGAHDRQWHSLADQSRATRPAHALEVYLRLAEPLRQQTGNRAYEELTSLLLAIGDCHRHLGSEDDFTTYLTTLRTGLKRRRNLMLLLDQHGL
ncbi:hypothetical protein C9F11_46580 (plasmid) [Streptomyces sp. YIM 121038]|nr:hypothetical protein C9F11_46580 [Streptomyces sp. YIM 121038]